MRDSPALQQAAIAGQQDPLLVQADVSQSRVVGATRPPHVETEHPKQPREPTEGHIDDEPRIAQRHRPQSGRGTDVQGLEHRVGGDAVTSRRSVTEVRRIAVHQDEVNFGVRNAHRLQHVLDGLVRPERAARCGIAELRRQEVVELGVHADLDVADALAHPKGPAPAAAWVRVITGRANPASHTRRRTASPTESIRSVGTKAITQPPKPPPVIRAPRAPAPTAVSAIRSMCSVVISKSSRMDACEEVKMRPASAKSELPSAATKSTTRRFSVST